MKCPSCGKPLHAQSSICKYCSVRIARQSDKMAHNMNANARIALASGGLLVVIAAVLAIYHAFIFAGVIFAVGAVLMFIGKMMD